MRAENIPAAVAQRARAMGPSGEKWRNELGETVALLAERWRLRVGAPMTGGTHAFAAKATGADGGRYVIKIDMPDGAGHADFSYAVRALAVAAGRGYVRMYACDMRKRACLLEELGTPLENMGYAVDRKIELICAALTKSWIPVAGGGLQTGEDIVRWFRTFLSDAWEALGQPCPADTITQARAFLSNREDGLGACERVLVHGDAHGTNVLCDPAEEGAFKLIDPDGILYERAYDLGVLMREWPEAYEREPVGAGLARCARLSGMTGVDARAIWEWGFLQCVSTGLLCLKIGQDGWGRRLLKVAEAWTGAEPPPR